MTFFPALIGLLCLFALLIERKGISFIIAGSTLIAALVFIGLRNPVWGPDTLKYVFAIQTARLEGFEYGSQFLFKTLGMIFKTESEIVLALFGVTTVLHITSFYLLLDKSWRIIALALTASLLTFEYIEFYSNTIRNGFAFFIFLMAVPFGEKGRYIETLLLCFSAIIIHDSILLLVFFYTVYLSWRQINYRYDVILSCFTYTMLIFLAGMADLPSFIGLAGLLSALQTVLSFGFFEGTFTTIEFLSSSDINNVSQMSVLSRLSFLGMFFPVVYISLAGKLSERLRCLIFLANGAVLTYVFLADLAYSYRLLYLGGALVPLIVAMAVSCKIIRVREAFVYILFLMAVLTYKIDRVQIVGL